MNFLDAPAFLDKARRKIIQQFRMAGRFGHGPEVVRRGHKSFAEMMQPDAVDHDARRHGIALADDGMSKLEPSAAVGKGWPVWAGQHFQEMAWRSCSFVAGIAA